MADSMIDPDPDTDSDVSLQEVIALSRITPTLDDELTYDPKVAELLLMTKHKFELKRINKRRKQLLSQHLPPAHPVQPSPQSTVLISCDGEKNMLPTTSVPQKPTTKSLISSAQHCPRCVSYEVKVHGLLQEIFVRDQLLLQQQELISVVSQQIQNNKQNNPQSTLEVDDYEVVTV